MLRHTRPFKCFIGACRLGDGHSRSRFGTKNDLDRHQKCRHRVAPGTAHDRSYRCAAPSCVAKGTTKVWPRLDNFRQHCQRQHKEVADIDALVQASCVRSETNGYQAQAKQESRT